MSGLSNGGEPLDLDYLTELVGGYVTASGVKKKGASHIFRPTMAGWMLEGGADIRFIQAMPSVPMALGLRSSNGRRAS